MLDTHTVLVGHAHITCCTRARYLLDTHTLRVGHTRTRYVLDTHTLLVGHAHVTCWTRTRYLLDTHTLRVGHTLITCWTHTHITCWTRTHYEQEQRWVVQFCWLLQIECAEQEEEVRPIEFQLTFRIRICHVLD